MVLAALILLSGSQVVIDSDMTPEQALGNNRFPQTFVSRMGVFTVDYTGFDGKDHRGQIVVDRSIGKEVQEIFVKIKQSGYRIQRVIPISRFNWSDSESIAANNTSAFNYRRVIVPGAGSGVLSKHSYGRAIDLNPYQNPFVSANGHGPRPYNPRNSATLTSRSVPVRIFKSHGWIWGGDYHGGKDYQHFQKPG